MNEGKISAQLGVAGVPNAAEAIIVERDILLAELTGAQYHVLHISTAEAVEAVRSGETDLAIIPVENSLHGRIGDIHHLLPASGLYIVGEFFQHIEHCLMAPKGATLETVKDIYSHPQALGQSRFFLRERGIVPLAYADTAGAAAFVAEQGDTEAAAIAPKIAAELYGLKIIAENVEDAADNMTRFVVLSRQPLDPATLTGTVTMTTFVFEVKNIPAALYKALGGFATNGVNMTKLESYQKGASFAATRFYADIVGAPGDPAVDRALEELAFHCKELLVLGTYPQGRARG